MNPSCLLAVVSLVATLEVASAHSVWIIGEKEHPWEKAGTLWALDTTTRPGWIQPEYADSTVNLVRKIKERGGAIWSPQWWARYLENVLADGDLSTGWNMVPYAASHPVRGVSLIIDLGATFPVNRITLSTGEERKGAKVNILKGYEVFLGGTGEEPKYDFLMRDTENENPDIDIRFRTQFVRHIKLKVATDYGFVINEVGVYGSGYAPRAEYLSHPIDLEGPANFGTIKLAAQIDPKARILLRTRTGLTPDPFIYYKKTGTGEEVPVSREEYEALPKNLKGRIVDDLDNWSSWSFPYDVEALLQGTPIISPGNRRYLQFKIDFITEATTDKASVDFVSFEYSTPPVAHKIVAEVSPIEVVFGQVTEFKYFVRPTIRGNDTGFDALEIRTPYKAEVKEVKIDNSPVNFSSQVKADRFIVFLDRKVETEQLIEINFSCLVTVYGTTFWGRAFDSQTDEFPQDILPGDATPDVDTNSLSIIGTLERDLLKSVAVWPNPFTPNGDGINDSTTISYTLLKAKKQVNVKVSIYDLQGGLIRTLYSSKDKAGPNSVRWDGTDREGKLLPPGIYIYQISVNTDTGKFIRTGTITLVY